MNEADGTILVTGDVAVVAFERRLRHAPEAVWVALTEPGNIEAWLGPGTFEARAGGHVELRTGPEDRPEWQRVMAGKVLTFEPPRLLEYEWSQPGLDVSIVRFELEPVEGGTLLRFTHRRSVAPGAFGGRAGWHAYLDRLSAYLDGGEVPGWSVLRAAVQDAYGEAPIGGS